MSSYFSKVIKAGGKLREFNFRLSSLQDDSKYTVDVPDDKGKRIQFYVARSMDHTWKVNLQLVPEWIYEAELLLSEAIEENRVLDTARKK